MSDPADQHVQVRAADASDVAAIAPLLDQLGYPTSPDEARERLSRLAANPGAGELVACLAEEIVGVVAYQVMDLLERPQPQCRITSLVVHQDHRRRGVATSLLSAVDHLARDLGCFRLEVTTQAQRSQARSFYAAYDFVERPHRLVKPLGGT